MPSPPEFGNNLFPVFFRLEEMKVLIIGGGHVGLEKLTAVLSNSPKTNVRLVALTISSEVRNLAKPYKNVQLFERDFKTSDLDNAQLVIIGINDVKKGAELRELAHARNLLVNIADKPELCDFYISSVVKKGDLKIAISTNGKSPTLAKRMKEFLNESIPDSVDDVLQNMSKIREKLRGDFDYKIKKLNEITKDWKNDDS
jgi:siroheme synthase-like protein